MPERRSGLSVAGPPHQGPGDLRRRRTLAKAGMTASLGVLAATGVMEGLGKRTPMVRTLHVLSGLGMIGFSLWHYSLYGNSSRSV